MPQSVHSGVPVDVEHTRSVSEHVLPGGQQPSPSSPQGSHSPFVQTRCSPTIAHAALAATQTLGFASSSQQPPVH
jgi:hypothetical protein